MRKMSNEFTMKLAGIPIRVQSLYSKTKTFCHDFLSDDESIIDIKIDPSDLAYERNHAERAVARCCDEYLETLAVYRKIADQLPEHQTLLMHGSALALDGNGYLFAAVSGAGKSTHAALWRRAFGDRVMMVNDDKPLLRVDGETVYVCGTPWNGKHALGNAISVPLKAICFLYRNDQNEIELLDSAAGYYKLLNHCYRPRTAKMMEHTLCLLDQIVDRVPLYRLGCNMQITAAYVALNGMEGNDQSEIES